MKLDADYIKRIADATGFDAVQLEKLIRLRQLLVEFRKHPFLHERLVLKGGTAVNLFYLELARLSVDVDLNYVGQLDREEMQRERPEIVKATEQITEALGYKVQRSADDYALTEWFLTYQNHIGRPDQIQIEINFLMRACALAPQLRQTWRKTWGVVAAALLMGAQRNRSATASARRKGSASKNALAGSRPSPCCASCGIAER